MTNKAFTYGEMENIFEIGRHMQYMVDNDEIEIDDSKNAFLFAMQLAVEFEKQLLWTEDYYENLIEFIEDKILEEFNGEN